MIYYTRSKKLIMEVRMSHLPLLFGGLALFLFGMHMMGEGLELLAGNKLQKILEKLTSNKITGVLVGAFITAIIQSSSATTVMAVGFVNSKIMTLTQAVYIIMGANIGTTITGQLLTLNIKAIAPVLAFIGMVLLLFIKKRKYKYAGEIILGFGLLFMGIDFMGGAVAPLKSNPDFAILMSKASNPVIAILIGTIVTAILQSSSATNGILQTLAANGLVMFNTSFFIILGQNIGTCITSLLASIGTSKNAKRAAMSHVLFNVFGTLVFSVLAIFTPIVSFIADLTPNSPKSQIANMHTFFNISTTLLLFPFTSMLVKSAYSIIKGEDQDLSNQIKLNFIKTNGVTDSIIIISSIKQELMRMFYVAKSNITLSISNFIKYNEKDSATIEYNEEMIDYLNKEITKYSVKTMTNNLSKSQYMHLSYYIKICSNIERIGDYAYNINNLATEIRDKNLRFSETAIQEIDTVALLVDKVFLEISMNLKDEDFNIQKIRTTAFRIQDIVEKNRFNHVERMKSGICDTESGLIYDKFYTYLLRVRDHLINIANSFSTLS